MVGRRLRGRGRGIALAAQADTTRPWDHNWGDLLEQFQSAGRLTPDRWAQYCRQALPGLLRLQVRPTVRRGDPLPSDVRFSGVARVADSSSLSAGLRWVALTCPDAPAFHFDFDRGLPFNYYDVRNGSPLGSPHLPADAITALPDDGASHDLIFTADVQLGTSDPQPMRWSLSTEGRHMAASGRVTATCRFTPVPADRPTVTAVPDPSLADAVSQSLAVSARWEAAAGRSPASVVVEVDSQLLADVDVAFDVIVRQGGREFAVGKVVHDRHGAIGAGYEFACPSAVVRGRPVDVIFRSDPDAAAAVLDVTTVWGGEITVAGVQVP